MILENIDWIPVTESLPEHGAVVLVWREVPSSRLRLAWCNRQIEDGWFSVPGTWQVSHVTHWTMIGGPKS